MNTPAPVEPLAGDDLRLLAEIGFMAADAGQPSLARKLFRALRVVRPDGVGPIIGIAVAEMCAGRHQEAVRVLREEGLCEHPGHGEITAFLGLALMECRQTAQARDVLARLASGSDADEAHLRMARKLLSMCDPTPRRDRPAPSRPRLNPSATSGRPT